jgi:hypothetical protein
MTRVAAYLPESRTAPPAPADVTADRGVRQGPLQALDFGIEWSREGDAVATREGDHVIGFIIMESETSPQSAFTSGEHSCRTPLNLWI